MSKRIVIWPYKLGSAGSKELATALGIRRLRTDGSTYRPRHNDIVINWGNSYYHPNDTGCNFCYVNDPRAVRLATNKMNTLCVLFDNNVTVPPFTTDMSEAKFWVEQGATVYCRTRLSSYGGRGIIVAKTPDDVVRAPLYTMGIPCKREYRVHVFMGNVIDVTRKARRIDSDGNPDSNADLDIRNHDNGWIFQRDGFETPPTVCSVATDAISALGLDFGAVDVVVESGTNHAYVLEVNTAAGVTGTTVRKYAEAINALY